MLNDFYTQEKEAAEVYIYVYLADRVRCIKLFFSDEMVSRGSQHDIR